MTSYDNRLSLGEINHDKEKAASCPPRGADTVLRLSRYFGTSPQFWLGLQTDYDLDIAEEELADRLEHEVKTYIKAG